MKRTLLTLLIITATMVASVAASYIGPVNMTCDGLARKFIYYLPETAQSGDKLPVIIFVHGIGAYNTQFYPTEAQKWADANHCAVLAPQALPEQDQTLLALLSMVNSNFANELKKSAWGANAFIRISDLDATSQALIQQYAPAYYNAGKIQINKDVNDAKFIREAFNKLEDILESERGIDINADKVYIVGLSLGGAMSYNYAFSTYSNVKKLVAMSGFLSKGVSVPSSYNLPTLIFHSKTDDVVTYSGGLINRAIEGIVEEIAATNSHSTPEISVINPESANKKVTVSEWKENPKVTFYAFEKANHVLEGSHGLNIFDITDKFLFDSQVGVTESRAAEAVIYPNPVADVLNINADAEFTHATVTSLAGQTFRFNVTDNQIDVQGLAKGLYIINLMSADGTVEQAKFIKK